MQNRSDYIDNEMGEQLEVNRLIIMDDVSGLADKPTEFSNFLTVSQKYGFPCLYVFHTIYPGRQSWEMIMSQTHIFNFFLGLYTVAGYWKFFRFLQVDKKTIICQISSCGSIDFISRSLTWKKGNTLLLTREMWTSWDQVKLGHPLTKDKNRYATSTEARVIPILLPALQREFNRKRYYFLLLRSTLATIWSIKASKLKLKTH